MREQLKYARAILCQILDAPDRPLAYTEEYQKVQDIIEMIEELLGYNS